MSFKGSNANAARLKVAIEKRPFLYFGLPFISLMVAGSFFLTPFAATRYEIYDKRQRFVDKNDAIDSAGVKRRKFDAREEYYRLAAKDLEQWEQRRISRPGESKG